MEHNSEPFCFNVPRSLSTSTRRLDKEHVDVALIHFYVITAGSLETWGNAVGGMVSASAALWHLINVESWKWVWLRKSIWKSKKENKCLYIWMLKTKHPFWASPSPSVKCVLGYTCRVKVIGKQGKKESECARERFCCSKSLSTVEKCDWLHIHSAGALPQWSTGVCSLNSAELIRIYLTSVGRHLHSLQNCTNNSRAQAAVHTTGILNGKSCRYSTQGIVQ